MAQKRQTMVTAFAGHGFRTVAMMPGLKKAWPEGVFYRFDQIYDAEHLGYGGAWFGWFGIPDEFTVARLDRFELSPTPRQPAFVFLPTLSTHFPFGPTPPYQSDWQRMISDDPYDLNVMYNALGDEPDWKNLAPSYVKAVSYAYQTIGGYLRFRPGRDFVLIALGDHQPAAAVSGERASWDVPVHVVASNAAILDRLIARGFHPGLSPPRQSIGRMHALGPVLLDAFGSSPAAIP
jgi:phosphoglycerol transferase MdoB-like AlkP superfamily enzyme